MSITYYANKVKETSITTGIGNMVLSGAPLGFKGFVDGIGSDKTLTYHIYRQDTNFEWEIGVGYILSSGGINQLVRQRVISSTNSNNFVGFTGGTKFIETIISEDQINNGLLNVEQKSSSFSAPYAPAIYVLDASAGNIVVDLPQVSTESDPILISFILNATSGSVYEQINAIELNPYSLETINGVASEEYVSILSDCLQLVSIPSQSGWVKLDPIQDSTNPYGNDGYIQFKYDAAFSGVDKLFWDNSSSSLLIGNTGLASADILLSSETNQETIFNQNLHDKDFRIAGTGTSHLLFVDGGTNNIGLNSSSPNDILTINANNRSGIYIYKSGIGPSILLGNTSSSGLATNNIVGSIVFSGLSSSNNPVTYAKIATEIESPLDGSENSNVSISIISNGSYQEAAVFSPSGTNLGFNNSNIDGTIIGYGSANEGNNVVLGYYNNVCGENCVGIGDNITVSSGSFGGAIGSNHAVSGNNIWVFGGDGVSVTGDKQTYVAIDNDNYIAILDSGNITITTSSDDDCVFSIKNKSILTSGINQSLIFTFINNVGIEKTGLAIDSSIDVVSSGQESTSVNIKIINDGIPIDVLSINASGLNLGDNATSGNNTILGYNNVITESGNIIVGHNIDVSGTNNIVVGDNIECSGSNISIFGRDNICLDSGNLNVVILGKGNEVDEDNVVSVGIDNANSGLYSFSFGYMNGVHGDYSVGIGESNLITSNSSVAVGKNNTISATALNGSALAVGLGNNIDISHTGLVVGYLNNISGSGSFVIGNNCVVSGLDIMSLGHNNQILGFDNIVIGNNRSIADTGIIDISYNDNNGIRITSSGLFLKSESDVISDSISVSGTGTFGLSVISSGNISCSGTGIFNNIDVDNLLCNNNVDVSGNISCSGTGVFNTVSTDSLLLNNISDVAGTGSVSILVTQDGGMYKSSLATSGIPSTGLQLLGTDPKYQFLYPTGTTYVYLPNGTGLYMGKEFFVVNMDNSDTIYVRKSGSATNIAQLPAQTNLGFVHAGDDNWIRINYHSGGYSYVNN